MVTSTGLTIDNDAQTAFIDASTRARWEGHTGTSYTFGLAAAAPRIVAAELRRQAEAMDQRAVADSTGSAWVVRRCAFLDAAAALRARADELDPPT